MAGGAPDVNQLLELLRRAADELKVSQHETQTARADAESFAKKLLRVEGELAQEKERSRRLQGQIEDFGVMTLPPTPREDVLGSDATVLKKEPAARAAARAVTLVEHTVVRVDDATNVAPGDPLLLERRLKALQSELRVADDERRALKEKLKAAEQALEVASNRAKDLESAPGAPTGEIVVAGGRDGLDRERSELEHALATAREQLVTEQARSAELATRLEEWDARVNELEGKLAVEQASVADNDAIVTQNSQFEAELLSLQARSGALEAQLASLEETSAAEHRALNEANLRIVQLEQDFASVRTRRDELNVELGRLEGERKALRARVAELESGLGSVKGDEAKAREQLLAEHTRAREEQEAAHKKLVEELEVQLGRERDKLQITAQKLLEARTHTRELEIELEKAVTNVGRREGDLIELAAAHTTELTRLRADHAAAVSSLQGRIGELDAQLDRATAEWRHVERQYEQLHREMLAVLDQRDEARRELGRLKPS